MDLTQTHPFYFILVFLNTVIIFSRIYPPFNELFHLLNYIRQFYLHLESVSFFRNFLTGVARLPHILVHTLQLTATPKCIESLLTHLKHIRILYF